MIYLFFPPFDGLLHNVIGLLGTVRYSFLTKFIVIFVTVKLPLFLSFSHYLQWANVPSNNMFGPGFFFLSVSLSVAIQSPFLYRSIRLHRKIANNLGVGFIARARGYWCVLWVIGKFQGYIVPYCSTGNNFILWSICPVSGDNKPMYLQRGFREGSSLFFSHIEYKTTYSARFTTRTRQVCHTIRKK